MNLAQFLAILYVISLIVSVAVGIKKKIAGEGIIAGLLLGPIGMIYILLKKPRAKCSYCGGLIEKGAIKCKHCGADLKEMPAGKNA